jgi:hypothetical protein
MRVEPMPSDGARHSAWSAIMVKALQWLLCFYLMLKLIQYFLVARPGFGSDEPSLREKLVRGEPIVFIVACAISVPLALWSSWYFQRGYERGLEHSADCYGQLGALRHLRDIESEFDALQVFRSVRSARGAASLASQALDLAPGDADRLMAAKLRLYTQRYAAVTRHGDREAMRVQAAAIERCMRNPGFSF